MKPHLRLPPPPFFMKSGAVVIKINCHYLYFLAGEFGDLRSLGYEVKRKDVLFPLHRAITALDAFLNNSIWRIKPLELKGNELLARLRGAMSGLQEPGIDLEQVFEGYQAFALKDSLREFETIMAAEMAVADSYLVAKKRGFDTFVLIEGGEQLFPPSLQEKVPEAVADVKAGARCLAFELFTASGYHFHRANEAVVRKYYDAIAGGKERPKSQNMGDYLNAMKTQKLGDEKVLAALWALKDLHRNPLAHPEHSIANADDAIALLGSINAAVVYMLAAIPALPKPAILASA